LKSKIPAPPRKRVELIPAATAWEALAIARRVHPDRLYRITGVHPAEAANRNGMNRSAA